MNLKQRTIWTILLTFCLAGTAIAQTAAPTALIVNYDQTVIPGDLEPGDQKTLYIVIQNTGGMPARDVSASLPSSGGLSTPGSKFDAVTSGGNWFLGSINPGSTVRLVTSIRVDESARVGTHYLTMYLTYDESRYTSSGSIAVEEEKSNWVIPVEVVSGSLLELSSYGVDKNELKAGDNIKVRLSLGNTGEGDALDVDAYLGLPLDGSPANLAANAELYSLFTVLGASKKVIGDIPKGSVGVVDGVIHIDENTPSKAYTLPFTAEYEDNSGMDHIDTFFLGVYITGDRKLSITNFKTDPTEVHSDQEDVEFSGSIENQGTEQVKNVKVVFKPDYPMKNARSFIQSKEVGTIKGGASTSFTFYADVIEDIDPQQTNVTFQLEYEADNQPVKDEISFQLDILENPRFELKASSSPTKPSAKGTARITLSNIGSACEDVTLIVLEKRDQPFSFEDKSAYIGDIDAGEQGVASIIYTVEEDAPPQPHIVPLEVRCTKNDEVLVYAKTLSLTVGEKVEGVGGVSTLMFVLVAIVIAVLVLSRFRKREEKIDEVKKK